MGQRPGEVGGPARMGYQPRITVDIESDGRSRQGERPEEIEARIAYTRAELSETLQELQERLNPAHVAEQVKSSVRAATIGRVEEMVHKAGHTAEEARLSMMDTIRQNPVPAAMVGIGLAWLMNNRSSRSDTQRYRYAYEYEGPEYGSYQSGSSGYGASQGRVRQMAGSVQERASTMADSVQERASSMAGSVQEGASTMAGSVQQGVGNVAHQARHVVDEMTDDAQFLAQQIAGTVQEQASNVRQQVSELGTGMQHQARVAGDRMQELLHENPMGVGVMALAAGMVVGMLLPETRMEHQMMGETRDQLMHQARTMASDTMQKVQHVASEVASETVHKVQDAASDVADTATRTARETARSEGLTSA